MIVDTESQEQAKLMREALEKQAPTFEKGGGDLGNLVSPKTPAISNNKGQSYSR